MNLQENIRRILREESKKDFVKVMIDNYGLYDTIKYVGGYDKIEPFIEDIDISKEDKIDFIKNVVIRLAELHHEDGISMFELGENPMLYGESDDQLEQIEYFNPEGVYVDVYTGHEFDTHYRSFTERYEDLNDDILDEVYKFMIDNVE
jgi:hypothetical protein